MFVFIIVEEHVSQCDSVVCCVFISYWVTMELCVTEEQKIWFWLHKQDRSIVLVLKRFVDSKKNEDYDSTHH